MSMFNIPETDQECLKLLESYRWPDGPTCPSCGSKNPYILKNTNRYSCRIKGCRNKYSALVGTVFENTKIPLKTWFLAIQILAKDDLSTPELALLIDASQKTAWFLKKRIKENTIIFV